MFKNLLLCLNVLTLMFLVSCSGSSGNKGSSSSVAAMTIPQMAVPDDSILALDTEELAQASQKAEFFDAGEIYPYRLQYLLIKKLKEVRKTNENCNWVKSPAYEASFTIEDNASDGVLGYLSNFKETDSYFIPATNFYITDVKDFGNNYFLLINKNAESENEQKVDYIVFLYACLPNLPEETLSSSMRYGPYDVKLLVDWKYDMTKETLFDYPIKYESKIALYDDSTAVEYRIVSDPTDQSDFTGKVLENEEDGVKFIEVPSPPVDMMIKVAKASLVEWATQRTSYWSSSSIQEVSLKKTPSLRYDVIVNDDEAMAKLPPNGDVATPPPPIPKFLMRTVIGDNIVRDEVTAN